LTGFFSTYCLFFCRLKINHDSYEFILEFGTVANKKGQDWSRMESSRNRTGNSRERAVITVQWVVRVTEVFKDVNNCLSIMQRWTSLTQNLTS
jgi:hypothetical protein